MPRSKTPTTKRLIADLTHKVRDCERRMQYAYYQHTRLRLEGRKRGLLTAITVIRNHQREVQNVRR